MLKGFIGRRVTHRVPFEAEINIQFEFEGKEPIIANASNISPGGMQFSVPKGSIQLPPDDIVELIFNLPNSTNATIRGEICYFSYALDQNRKPISCYGVKFLDLPLDTWNSLNEFCQSKQGEETPDAQQSTKVSAQPAAKTITSIKPSETSTSEPFTSASHPTRAPYQSLSQDTVDQLIQTIAKNELDIKTSKKTLPIDNSQASTLSQIPEKTSSEKTAVEPEKISKPAVAETPLVHENKVKEPLTNSAPIPDVAVPKSPDNQSSQSTTMFYAPEAQEKSLMDLVKEFQDTKSSTNLNNSLNPSTTMESIPGNSLMDLVMFFQKSKESASPDPEPNKIPSTIKPTPSETTRNTDEVSKTGIQPTQPEIIPSGSSDVGQIPSRPVNVVPKEISISDTNEKTVAVLQPTIVTNSPLTTSGSDNYTPIIKGSSLISMDQEMIDRILNSMRPNSENKTSVSTPPPEGLPKSTPSVETTTSISDAISTPSIPVKPVVYSLRTTKVFIELKNNRKIQGTLTSINFGGLMAILSEPIPTDSLIKIDLLCQDIRLSDLKGIVTSSDPVPNSGKREENFVTGIFFENLSGNDFDKLRTLIFKLRVL